MGAPFKEVIFNVPFDLDFVHANAPGIGLLGAYVSWKRRIPRVISYHTPLIDYLHYLPIPFFILKIKKIMNFWEKMGYNQFALTIVPTEGVKKSLIKRGFKGPFGFFPTCLDLQCLPKPAPRDTESFRQRYDLKDKKIILFVGRMGPEKGIDQILQLVPAIVKEDPTAHFLMVGKGPYLEQYKQIAHQNQLDKSVTFTGYLSEFDLFTAVNTATMGLIFASGSQIFDMTILEYWNYGLPLVIRNAMGIDEVIHDKENGLLFNTLEGAKANILAILKNDKLADQIRVGCCFDVHEKYDIRKIIPRLEHLYGQGAINYWNSI
jgi:1,2-diacylglycerol 3-alpha-glucosyltransferase